MAPSLGLNIRVPKKGDINEQDTIFMLLILTVYIPKGTFGEVITLPHVTKLGLTVNMIPFLISRAYYLTS